jgi:hypothetical protein
MNHKVELGGHRLSEFLLVASTCFGDLGAVWCRRSARTFAPLCGGALGESLASAFDRGRQRRRSSVVHLLGGVVVELSFSLLWGCGSSREISSFGLPKRAMVTDTPLPRWRHRLGESACGCLAWSRLSTRWWTSGQRPREVMLVRQGGGLRNHREW